MDSKQILTLNKRQSIVQRIDAMKASFSANKIKDKLSRYHYFGYPSQILIDKLISKTPSDIDKGSFIAVENDFGLEVISQLQMLGYTNLTLLCTESDDKLYNIIKYMVEKEFNFTNIERLQDMRIDDKFDLVIANPPYEIGNAVITETMEHCEEAVVLMPISKYKKGNLFKQVKSFELVPADAFSDAQIGDGLYIAELDQSKRDLDWNKFELDSYDDRFKLIYNYINNTEANYKYISLPKLPYIPDPDTEFMITMRTVQNGTHRTADCADYPFNVLFIYDEKNIPIDITYKRCSCAFLKFNTKQEKKNFSNFWYNGQLMNALIKGLKKASGTVYAAIPNIDWSRTDVEYTDEYVLSQMGLKMLKDGRITEIHKLACQLNAAGFETYLPFSDNFKENAIAALNNQAANAYKQ